MMSLFLWLCLLAPPPADAGVVPKPVDKSFLDALPMLESIDELKDLDLFLELAEHEK